MSTENNNNNSKKFVRWQVFAWAFSILTFLIITMSSFFQSSIASLNNKTQVMDRDITETKIFISEIHTDMRWVKLTLEEIKNNK